MEIGWSWLWLEYQGQGINRVVKFLMLQYAFEILQIERVEFRTRGTNFQSQRVLTKIGAQREGCLRSYSSDQDQRHDLIYYSILKPDWVIMKTSTFKI